MRTIAACVTAALLGIACASPPPPAAPKPVTPRVRAAKPAQATADSPSAGASGTDVSPASEHTGAATDSAPSSSENAIGGDRPIQLVVPTSYSEGTPVPLVVLLAGYSMSGAQTDAYLGMSAQAEARGFLLAIPDGRTNPLNHHYWNATNACCNFYKTEVDDSAYLRQVIDEIKAAYSVDPKRVYIIGYSNGGFMAHRMACEHADTIAAIASLAGAMFTEPARCAPSQPVSVLQIHGTADPTIAYDGGTILGTGYPGARATVDTWIALNQCAEQPLELPEDAASLDLDRKRPGSETAIQRHERDCLPGGAVELWTLDGSNHHPAPTAQFAPAVIEFLFAHAKP